MKKFLSSIPLPVCAIMLSCATLGNIIGSSPARPALGIIASALGIIILLKIIITSGAFKSDMENPVVASTFVTFPMGLVVLSTYLKPFTAFFAKILWSLGILIHFIIIVYLLIKFIVPTKKILPSYYVAFVGVVVGSVTSPAFSAQTIGIILFVFGFVCFVVLSFWILRNLFSPDSLPAPANPTKVIVAAPLSLLLLGYLNSASSVNKPFALVLSVVSFILTLIGVYFIFTTLKKEFNPAYAAYTFPMVISSFAMKGMAGLTVDSPQLHGIFQALFTIEFVFAVVVVLIVFLYYIGNFARKITA